MTGIGPPTALSRTAFTAKAITVSVALMMLPLEKKKGSGVFVESEYGKKTPDSRPFFFLFAERQVPGFTGYALRTSRVAAQPARLRAVLQPDPQSPRRFRGETLLHTH